MAEAPSKLAQLKALRERGQGGIRADKPKRMAKVATKAMLDKAVQEAMAAPAESRKKTKGKRP